MSLLKKRIGLLLVVSLGFFSALALAQSKGVLEAIESRLKPVGEICMAGDECAAAPTVSHASDEPRDPSDIYGSACASCHDSGASGAPIVGSADDWAPRLEKGTETLYDSAINGLGAMPAMGLCMDCSEEEIQDTVDYMIEEG